MSGVSGFGQSSVSGHPTCFAALSQNLRIWALYKFAGISSLNFTIFRS